MTIKICNLYRNCCVSTGSTMLFSHQLPVFTKLSYSFYLNIWANIHNFHWRLNSRCFSDEIVLKHSVSQKISVKSCFHWKHLSVFFSCHVGGWKFCISQDQEDLQHHTSQMFINLASYQPPPGAPRGHFCCDECCWEQTDDICPLVSVGECVAVEIRSVYINLASHANQVPGHGSISTHLQAREISINITIKS